LRRDLSLFPLSVFFVSIHQVFLLQLDGRRHANLMRHRRCLYSRDWSVRWARSWWQRNLTSLIELSDVCKLLGRDALEDCSHVDPWELGVV
jgi:hypothetical protein